MLKRYLQAFNAELTFCEANISASHLFAAHSEEMREIGGKEFRQALVKYFKEFVLGTWIKGTIIDLEDGMRVEVNPEKTLPVPKSVKATIDKKTALAIISIFQKDEQLSQLHMFLEAAIKSLAKIDAGEAD
mmetsp:Transcript_33500/g.51440  ORF Transcript_33500/g.51440 Transcript_33500/m.51440 type:complete len:131 (-) Transcript_33500:1079-1471(-)